MKRWGLVVTLVYALIVLVLLTPAALLLASRPRLLFPDFEEVYRESALWILAGTFIVGEFLLLSLSVDTKERRLRPRTRIGITAAISGVFLAIVTLVVFGALFVAIRGENKALDSINTAVILVAFFGPWVLWAIVFYRFYRDSNDVVTRAMTWLFRGSVLELLVAVPTHVIVRRRHDCCAPILTSFGITSGIALMLLSFGPSVLLYKKRIETYAAREVVTK